MSLIKFTFVIQPPQPIVGQHFVGSCDVAKPFHRLGIALVLVRMMDHGHLVVSGFDVSLRGLRCDLKDVVVVACELHDTQ